MIDTENVKCMSVVEQIMLPIDCLKYHISL
jgi:hypothetical protein